MRQKKEIKVMATASEMSNLVGTYLFFFNENQIDAIVYVHGKADNTHFICQVVSPLDGKPNIGLLMTIEQIKDCIILPNAEIATSILEEYYKDKKWRYSIPESIKKRLGK